MLKNDIIYILHILDAAKESLSFAKDKTRNDLDSNRMLTLSIVKSIEIIGEAATKVTKETKNEYPEIPWSNIIAMRNRLIHGYFDIDYDRVWDTVIDDLPSLISTLEEIVRKEKRD